MKKATNKAYRVIKNPLGEVISFLRESNAIEGVFDNDSLQQAIYAWDYLIKQQALNTAVILETHRILMLHQPLEPKAIGAFRRCKVWVGGREGLEWLQVPAAIDEWVKDAMTSVKIPGLNGRHIKLDHVNFEHIHPMQDGNGRLGRLLFLWQRIKARLPVQIIYEKARQSYYQWFH